MNQDFALIDYPNHQSDIFRRSKFMRRWPDWAADGLIRRIPPLKTAEITGLGTQAGPIRGFIISANLTAAHMAGLPAADLIKKLIRSGRLAEKMGARIVGLDSIAALVGDAGVSVARRLGIAVTTGLSYRVAAALEGCRRAVEMSGLELAEAEVMIIGVDSSGGGVVANLLAREGINYLTLSARDQHRLDNLARKLLFDTGISCKVTAHAGKAARRADLLVVIGANHEALPLPEDLKPGAVLCDLTLSQDFASRITRCRNPITVINGGVIKVPAELQYVEKYGFPPRTVSACAAETMVLALERRYEHYSLGRELRIGKVEEIGRLALKHGFSPDGLRILDCRQVEC